VRVLKTLVVLASVALMSACTAPQTASTFTPSAGSGAPGGPNLTAPAPDSPADDAQMDTLRPTLTVRNGTSDQPSGTRTYEFQVSDRSDFLISGNAYYATYVIADTATGIAEGSGGRTSYTPSKDLQPSTQLFWRARVVQGTSLSDWSTPWRVRTKITGYNRPGELYDTLVSGSSIGAITGPTTWMGADGLKLNTQDSFVSYTLAQTLTSGEISVEVKGLSPDNPSGPKLKIFSMMDGASNLFASSYLFNVQYRGAPGNPDNAISFKALYGGAQTEPTLAQRAAGVRLLDPSTTYLFKALWSSTAVQVIVQQGIGGATIYDMALPATGTYNPTPHIAVLGANRGGTTIEDGTYPGAIYRNFFVGNKPRPTSLGSAITAPR
jgi:hypothetical protein